MLETYPHFQEKLSQKRKEVKTARKLSKPRAKMTKEKETIDTTFVDTSQYDEYIKFLHDYEEMENTLNRKMLRVPADIFTREDD